MVIDDRTGWWLPYRIPEDRIDEDDSGVPLVDLEAEFHFPDWALGQATMAELPDGSLVCRMHRDGRDHLVRLHPPATTGVPGRPGADGLIRWDLSVVDQPCITIAGVTVAVGPRIGILGATATAGMGVYQVSRMDPRRPGG